tara:strand:- start:778 stop:1548 length:771 start_codon:yes stop_codon:yes gene_type:complete
MVLVHEAIHRGIAVWRKLVQAGLISPSLETDFVLRKSRYAGEKTDQATGEHAMVYNRLEPNSLGRIEKFIEPWWQANKEYLYNNFSIGKASFNDKYQDLRQTQDDAEAMGVREQSYLWLDIVYKKASQEIADVVGKKMLQSPTPKLRPGPKNSSPKPLAPTPGKGNWPSIPPQLDEKELVNLLKSIRNKLNTGKIEPNTVMKKLPAILAGATGLKIGHTAVVNVSKMFANRDRSSLSSNGRIETLASKLIQAALKQ